MVREYNPWCVNCKQPLHAWSKKRWRDYNCKYYIGRDSRDFPKRQQSVDKYEKNAWCIKCRQPMERHAPNFTCRPCHWSTRIHGTGSARLTFATFSVAITGQKRRYTAARADNPWCTRCKRRMQRKGKRLARQEFKCGNPLCGVSVTAHSDIKGRFEKKNAEAVRLLKEGYSNRSVSVRLHMHEKTVKHLKEDVAEQKLCECGLLAHHVRGCLKRTWKSTVERNRPLFDDLLARIGRKLQSGLPEAVRSEIAQYMLLDIAKSINAIMKDTASYVRQYKKEYPMQFYSIDSNPEFWTNELSG